MSRRNSFQVARDILAVADGGAMKTQLVYQANLNFKVVKKYLGDLIAKGLIVWDGSRYYTTDGGRAFIRLMSDADEVYGPQGVVMDA